MLGLGLDRQVAYAQMEKRKTKAIMTAATKTQRPHEHQVEQQLLR